MRIRIVAPAVVIALAGLIGATSFVLGETPPKTPPARPPEDVYNRVGAQIPQKQAAFLAAFNASGANPRTLPRFNVSSWAPGAASLSEAVRQADTIVVANVVATKFSANPSGGLPIADSTVAIVKVVVGDAPASIQVRQLGGPIEGDSGGVLAQLASDEVLLPGDSVVLFLTRGPDATLRVVPGGGLYRIAANRIKATEGNAFAASVRGLDLGQFLSLILTSR